MVALYGISCAQVSQWYALQLLASDFVVSDGF